LTYQADTLLQLFQANWSLTADRVTIANSPASIGKKRPIIIFAREQIADKIQTKAIEIIKQSPLISQEIDEFLTTETDEFLIRGRYKLQGISKDAWDVSESDMEDIEEEINRIIKITFNPQNGTNIFFTSSLNWRNKDDINTGNADPIAVRELTLRLTRLISRSNTVFDSFQRGVIFDVSASSNMDTPPASDVTYAEVHDVNATEGFRDKEIQVTDHPDGAGFPLFFAGGFGGVLTMQSYFDSSDVGAGTSTADLNQIYKRQSNGEKSEVAILRTYTNNNSQTLNLLTLIRVLEIKLIEPKSQPLQWQILGKIVKPTTMTIT